MLDDLERRMINRRSGLDRDEPESLATASKSLEISSEWTRKVGLRALARTREAAGSVNY